MAAPFICRRYVLNDDELSATFDLLDLDKDGRLNRVEIGALLKTVKVEPTRRELDFFFSEMDSDETGKIDKETFLKYLRSPPIYRFTIRELEEYFNDVDEDRDGFITESELLSILEKTADIKDEFVISELFRTADTKKIGRLSFCQFLQIMRD